MAAFCFNALLIGFCLLTLPSGLSAEPVDVGQTATEQAVAGQAVAGQVAEQKSASQDSLVNRQEIFVLLSQRGKAGNRVEIVQSASIQNAMQALLLADMGQTARIHGFRVRIFFDNKQSARNNSASILSQFKEYYPEIPAYLAYENPYFKVTVGDFRTKSEAIRFMNQIKIDYPSAFVTRELIELPEMESLY